VPGESPIHFDRELNMKLIRTLMAAAAIATPMFAQAGLAAGQYDVGGLQQICLVGDGTWYGTTYSAWGGRYIVKGDKTYIFGNFWSGDGNDSIVVFGNSRGPWTEWTDDLSYQTVLQNQLVTFVKYACDAPALTENGGKRPQDR
jgi:hypothetical protein